jgi:hypothetical protein
MIQLAGLYWLNPLACRCRGAVEARRRGSSLGAERTVRRALLRNRPGTFKLGCLLGVGQFRAGYALMLAGATRVGGNELHTCWLGTRGRAGDYGGGHQAAFEGVRSGAAEDAHPFSGPSTLDSTRFGD